MTHINSTLSLSQILRIGTVLLLANVICWQPCSNAVADEKDSAQVTGTFVISKDIDSFAGHVVEIRLFKIHPLLADAPADLVELVEIKEFAHEKGHETKKEFAIGSKAKLEMDKRYYLTLFITKDGKRTHMGEVPGKFLCTVLTMEEPSKVEMTVKRL